MRVSERLAYAWPPWSATVKLVASATATAAVVLLVTRSAEAKAVWTSLVERTDALAGTLLSVHASLLGFAVATFAIIVSLRSDVKFSKLEQFTRASHQMWDALSSASWATGVASFTALLVLVLTGGNFASWFEHLLTAALFVTTFYVTLTLLGVLVVVHVLVLILRSALPQPIPQAPPRPGIPFETMGGVPREDSELSQQGESTDVSQ